MDFDLPHALDDRRVMFYCCFYWQRLGMGSMAGVAPFFGFVLVKSPEFVS